MLEIIVISCGAQKTEKRCLPETFVALWWRLAVMCSWLSHRVNRFSPARPTSTHPTPPHPVSHFHYKTEWIWAAARITSPHLARAHFPQGSNGFFFLILLLCTGRGIVSLHSLPPPTTHCTHTRTHTPLHSYLRTYMLDWVKSFLVSDWVLLQKHNKGLSMLLNLSSLGSLREERQLNPNRRPTGVNNNNKKNLASTESQASHCEISSISASN